MKRKRTTRAGHLPALLAIVALVFSACNWDTKGSEQGAPALMGGAMQGVPLSLTGTTSTFAGVSLIGSQDGTGASARFNYPSGLARCGESLYVADTENHTIRKVVIATGEATTLTGMPGMPGSADGTGAAARFCNPHGITTDGTNLYVADTHNNTIRKVVVATGEVTTLAGTAGMSGSADGTGAAAQFFWPQGITTDGTNLYVADTWNNRIREVVIATGEVTTLAGSAARVGPIDGIGAAAIFFGPRGIATDGTNLYVTDYDGITGPTIRKVAIATAEVTTFAGSPDSIGARDGTGAEARFSRPAGIATDGTNLYVTDFGSRTIRKVAIATRAVTTLAGAPGAFESSDGTGAEARFNRPFGIATDGTNLYVGDVGDGVNDPGNQVIRKVVIATAEVTTLAGAMGSYGSADGTGTAARLRDPSGITTDGTNLFVADSGNHTIRKVTIGTEEMTTLAGTAGAPGAADNTGAAARFNSPRGITTDGTNLFVADKDNHTIRKVVVATGEVTTLAGAAGVSGSADGTGASARFYRPSGITTDGTNLYVAEFGNYTIRKVVIATGVVTTLAGSPGAVGTVDGIGAAARFCSPDGITTDGTFLYVADANSYAIRKVAIATGEVTTLAGAPAWPPGAVDGTGAAARFKRPAGITTDGTYLYVTDALGLSTIFANTDTGWTVAWRASGAIRKVAIATGEVTTLAGTSGASGSMDGTGAAARFYLPSGITTDGKHLYVTDTENNTIRRID